MLLQVDVWWHMVVYGGVWCIVWWHVVVYGGVWCIRQQQTFYFHHQILNNPKLFVRSVVLTFRKNKHMSCAKTAIHFVEIVLTTQSVLKSAKVELILLLLGAT
jgi:hypothetical protein